MLNSPNRLFQFWQELKRRKVIKVIAMYAATAFIIMEAGDIMLPRLGLPDWTVTFLIILLIVGFPVTVILSWIFDVTPVGIKKTEPVEGAKEIVTETEPSKRRLRSSDVIIAILVVIVGILVYPRIFKSGSSLNAMTIPVTVVNEFGEKETKKIFKEDYITKLAIYPFKNESHNSSENWLQYVIYAAVAEDLYQFNYMSLTANSNATHLQEQILHAKDNQFPYFLSGAFRENGGIYEITSRLYKTSNGSIIEENFFKGYNFFSLIDSLSFQTRIDLGISNSVLNSTPDLPINELLTSNLDALRSAIEGYYYKQLDYPSFYLGLNKAIKLDSTFVEILYDRARENYNYQISFETALNDINQAMRHRHRLSEYREISIRVLYYLIHGENDKAIALSEMLYELQPHDIRLLLSLIDTYERNFMIHKFEEAAKKLNELIPNRTSYQIMLARSYLLTKKLDKGLDVLENVLNENPENTLALLQMGEIFLHKNDLEAAEEVFRKAILFNPEDEQYWSKIFDHIDYVRVNPVRNNFLKQFTGKYRFDDSELTGTYTIQNNHLLFKSKNQFAYFRYPVSDHQFISYNGFQTTTFIKNDQGKVIKHIYEQRNYPDTLFTAWKEDSLISEALSLLNNGKSVEVQLAFQRALDQNTEHYYLRNFIQHLEFVQSTEYEELKLVFNTYSGVYGDMKLYTINNQLFYKNEVGFIYKLLPLTKQELMVPSFYDRQIFVLKENDSVTGLNFVYRNGDEEYYPRISEYAMANQNQ